MEPYPYEREWSARWLSHKFKGPGLRYEVALNILTGQICWINGPFACGKYNDWTIFSKHGLMDNLELNERVEADEIYKAGDPKYTKTPRSCFHKKEKKEMRQKIMGRQETINKRNKQWGATSKIFQHTMAKHSMVFRAVMVITELIIENGEPLFDCEYNDD